MAGSQTPKSADRLAGFEQEQEQEQEDFAMTGQGDESATVGLLQHMEDGSLSVEEPDGKHPEDEDFKANSQRERWNSPRINIYRYCGVNLSFFIMGMHDGCIGVRFKEPTLPSHPCHVFLRRITC
jgi:hypothetical protein